MSPVKRLSRRDLLKLSGGVAARPRGGPPPAPAGPPPPPTVPAPRRRPRPPPATWPPKRRVRPRRLMALMPRPRPGARGVWGLAADARKAARAGSR
jgi:hypothetical protein